MRLQTTQRYAHLAETDHARVRAALSFKQEAS